MSQIHINDYTKQGSLNIYNKELYYTIWGESEYITKEKAKKIIEFLAKFVGEE